MDATDDFFIPFWTDTRTGVQEIFCDRVYTKTAQHIHIPDEVAQILFGVTNDGGGVGGRGIIRTALNATKLEIDQALKNLAGRSRNIG